MSKSSFLIVSTIAYLYPSVFNVWILSLMLDYLSDKKGCKSASEGSKLIEAAIEIGFKRNELRPIEFGGDMGTKAVTEKLITLLKDKNVQNEVLT